MTSRGLTENCCEERSGVVAAARAGLRSRKLAARRRRLMYELDERMLRDIGLTRSDVLLRTLLDNAAAGSASVNMHTPETVAQRPLLSRAALALMIVTLSIAITVLAA